MHLWGIALAFFVYFAMGGILMPYVTPVLLEMGYGKESIGTLLACVSLLNTLMPVLFGRAADRWFGPQNIFRMGTLMLLFACSVLFFGWRAGWFVPLALTAVFMCRAPFASLLDTMAGEHAEGDPHIYGRLRLTGSFGFVIAVLTISLLPAESLTVWFRWGLLLIAMLMVLSSWFLPTLHARPKTSIRFWSHLPARFWIWLTAIGLHWVSFGPYNYGINLLFAEIGIPSSQWGALWCLGIGAEIAMFYLSGILFNHFSYRSLLMFAIATSALRWLILWTYLSPAAVWFTQPLHGSGFALYYAAAMAGIRDWSGGKQLASLQGLFTTVVGGAFGAIGYFMAGFLYSRMPFHDVLGYMLIPEILSLAILWKYSKASPLFETRPL